MHWWWWWHEDGDGDCDVDGDGGGDGDDDDDDGSEDGGDDGAENLGYTAILSVWHQGDNYRKLLLDFRHFWPKFIFTWPVLSLTLFLFWHYTQSQLQPIENTCISSRAFPEPVTSWIKNGEELDPSSSKRIRQTDTGNLVIRDVEKSDAGEYFCQVNIN